MVPPNDPRDEDDVTEAPRDDESEDRAAILRRRAMFIASAIAGLNLVSCEGEITTPQPCLDMGTTTAGAGGEPQPCLSQGGYGGEPQPCLGTTFGGMGGEPQPCLSMPATGGGGMGGAGGEPQPCLSMPATGGGGTGGEPQPCLDMAPLPK